MDKTNPAYIKVREQMVKILSVPYVSPILADKLADQILSIEGLAILDEDQSLPKNPYEPYLDDNVNYGRYDQSQQDMLNANFKRVIK